MSYANIYQKSMQMAVLQATFDVIRVVASCRFELQSQDPESRMIDHYTTRLVGTHIGFCF